MRNVLFVCLGNICRSPTAEGVMKSMVQKRGLEDKVFCDSAGTAAYHEGEPADGRMREHANERGYDLTSIARRFNPQVDFEKFDYILTMDDSNYRNIRALDPENRFNNKIHKMTSFCRIHNTSHVPDPYYGGDDGFRLVIDIIEDACSHLLDQLETELER